MEWIKDFFSRASGPHRDADGEKPRAGKRALAEPGAAAKLRNAPLTGVAKRESADYKRFFSVANKKLVFYSEGSGFYQYFRGIVEYLLAHSSLTIHYITSDPKDAVFALSEREPRIRPYYIGERKLIPLMMKMNADIVIMTMPDIENYHIKRSYVRDDIEYIYVPHGMDSLNLTMRTGAMDHYDTVFCAGKHQKEEIQKTEAVYGLPAKTLVECGYPLLDEMRAAYRAMAKPESSAPKLLIAPSWQPDNIVDSCLEELLSGLRGRDWQITVRPHPQYIRRRKKQLERLKRRYASAPDIVMQTEFSASSTVFEADLLLTDWSAIAYEYAYATRKPVLFINTPMKVMNPAYRKIDTVPLNILLREEIGSSLDVDKLAEVGDTAARLLADAPAYREKIAAFAAEYVYNPDRSAEISAQYILAKLNKRRKQQNP